MTYFLLIVATLITSLTSGVLSMAGGSILMGIFGFFLSVPAAMVLHGVTQAASNGSRIWLHRRHVQWNVFLPYTAGSLLILLLFLILTFVPSKGVMFLLIGSFPFIALLIPNKMAPDIRRKPVAFVAGLLVTTAQMLAGVSGPVLDLFYVKSSLTRHQIIGTKAITQTLGHVIKLGYYAMFLNLSISLPQWLFFAVVPAAIFGNVMGKILLVHIHDHHFKRIGSAVILLVSSVYIAKGLQELLS
ncbi:sulfite exporter TauE/SafE family protein [Microbulbifer bruguierae]|uniref:Probable membrane transporter protein n=1 Tax=Microbulbifer bruguierae TaxID=3029061 RepID=A0ABY8NCR2_9GAMM|nr:sulfite exporter TauE/SafE family protein [Microbulbifer bruguierae]WGL15542.1 sulfite exporter TauE/SafE family protein [Microbulbifer bruguierae]